MSTDIGCALFFVASYAVAIGTIIYAYSKRYDKFVLMLALCVLGGVAGSLISFLLMTAPKLEPPVLGEAEVEICPHCGAAYLSSEYRDDAAIICSDCRRQIRDALVIS